MIVPGEILVGEGAITTCPGAERIELDVVNTGDRPVQVGSHFHLAQVNSALDLDRSAARGFRLDVPAGTAVRFEPGIAQRISAVAIGGDRIVPGLTAEAPGALDGPVG